MRILLVEDDALCRDATTGLLRAAGHEVVACACGGEGVGAAARGSFDLVLMDLELPDMDGVEAAGRIRELRDGLPIVALTGLRGVEARRRCREAGLEDFLAKPLRRDTLAEAVRRLAGASEPPLWSASVRRLSANLRVSLARAFLEEGPRLAEDVREAIGRRNLEAVRHKAHTLFGALIHFDAPDAQARVRAVEEAAKRGDLAAARRLYPEMAEHCGRLLAAVDRAVR